jgi:hypothetical protein
MLWTTNPGPYAKDKPNLIPFIVSLIPLSDTVHSVPDTVNSVKASAGRRPLTACRLGRQGAAAASVGGGGGIVSDAGRGSSGPGRARRKGTPATRAPVGSFWATGAASSSPASQPNRPPVGRYSRTRPPAGAAATRRAPTPGSEPAARGAAPPFQINHRPVNRGRRFAAVLPSPWPLTSVLCFLRTVSQRSFSIQKVMEVRQWCPSAMKKN